MVVVVVVVVAVVEAVVVVLVVVVVVVVVVFLQQIVLSLRLKVMVSSSSLYAFCRKYTKKKRTHNVDGIFVRYLFHSWNQITDCNNI